MTYDVAAGELVPGGTVKCGNRFDLPKRQRVHDYVSLGLDTRNSGPLGYVDGTVLVCVVCGADKFTRRHHG
jgi:hypothetical protein